MENSNTKRVAPGDSLNFPKILTLIFGSQKCVFPKCIFSGPGMISSSFVKLNMDMYVFKKYLVGPTRPNFVIEGYRSQQDRESAGSEG